MSDLENLIQSFGYVAIFCLMIANGIVSLPSSQFVYVTAGFLVSSGKLEFFPIVIAGTIGNTIGNILLYEATRRKGLDYITRWRMFRKEKILGLECAFRRRGYIIIFIGKFLPGVKVVVPVAAGITKMNRLSYVTIIKVTSFLWAAGLTYFGVYFGRNSRDGTFGFYSIVFVLISIVAIYLFLRYVESLSLKPVLQ